MRKNKILLQEALGYAENGYPVFPCKTDKRPLTQNGFKDATTDPNQIKRWWSEHPDASIGIPTGTTTNIFVVDVDMPDGPGSLKDLEEVHGELPATLESKTGSGGRHLFFRLPDSSDVKNKVGLVPKVDIRGSGGYIIVPPSSHPSGKRYQWVLRKRIAAAPDWLISLCNKKKTATSKPPSLNNNGTSAYGAAILQKETEALAEAKEGTRNDTLNRTSFLLAQLVAGDQINEQEAVAAINSAASRCGLDTSETKGTFASGFQAGLLAPRSSVDKSATVHAESFAEFVRSTPVPFDYTETPELPIKELPGIIKDLSLTIAESVQIPAEVVMMNIFGAIATAVQRKIQVFVKPDYSENINIFASCALNPGERKSPVVKKCKKPLMSWEIQQQLIADEAIKDAISEKMSIESIIKSARNKLKKASTAKAREKLINEIKELEKEIPAILEPPRLLADDATPEALGIILSKHDERIGIIEAEGGIFETLAGRYSNNVLNVDVVLKAWGGESCKIDRINRETIHLVNPIVTMVVTAQPGVILGLAGKKGFRDRGFIGRFLFIIPKSMVGKRRIKTPAIPPMLLEHYDECIRTLLEIPWNVDQTGRKRAHTISLTPEAYDEWEAYERTIEAKLLEGAELSEMTDWGTKFPGQLIRLAGLIHCATTAKPHEKPVSLKSMRASLALAEGLKDHAKAAYQLMGTNPAMECAKAILIKIQSGSIETFSAREAFGWVRHKFKTMDKVRQGLSILVDHSYIFPLQAEHKHTLGRPPSEKYVVHTMVTNTH